MPEKVGFLDAILTGFITGFIDRWIAKVKVPEWISLLISIL
ncbi:hypothetical protein [Borrelia miyamotoi]|nr:hypothetical protein [Borrelia miyamotoi]